MCKLYSLTTANLKRLLTSKALHRPFAPNLGGEHRAKSVPPEPDCLVADVDPTLDQQILDVPQRQRKSDVHHHDQTDDLWRAVEISERIAHAQRLTQPGQPENFL
jgi:hypothetical protein